MKILKTKHWLLLCLSLLFIAPGVAAYLFYTHPHWLTAETTQKGKLLNPPVLFEAMKPANNKWRLIYWYPRDCDAVCRAELDMLARVRLALGRRLYQVELWLLANQDAKPLPQSFLQALQAQDMQVLQLSSVQNKALAKQLKHSKRKPLVFIANPNNYLVLAYAPTVNPSDVYKDLTLLLTTVPRAT